MNLLSVLFVFSLLTLLIAIYGSCLVLFYRRKAIYGMFCLSFSCFSYSILSIINDSFSGLDIVNIVMGVLFLIIIFHHYNEKR